MKWFVGLILLISNLLCANGSDLPIAKKYLDQGKYKSAIKTYEAILKTDNEIDKRLALRYLAESYYRNHEHAKAFSTFLLALEAVPFHADTYKISDSEEALYQEALHLYLSNKEKSSKVISQKIKDIYAGVWRLNQSYAHLGFILALSYANLSEFQDFFDIFYKSYLKMPNHFLAYKAKIILYIKLYDMAKTPLEKDIQRKKIIENIKEAKRIYPYDASIYKMEIAFSLNEEEILEQNVNEIVDKQVNILSNDIPFYIDKLLAFGKFALADKFITYEEKKYPYNQSLISAKKIIEAKHERIGDGARSSR